MAHRDFDVPERQPGAEITFTVAGRPFRALPAPPISAVLRMGNPSTVLAELVQEMLVPEDEEAWRALLADKTLQQAGDDGLGRVVTDVFWWIVEEQTLLGAPSPFRRADAPPPVPAEPAPAEPAPETRPEG